MTLDGLGLNALTATFIGIVATNIIGMWGSWKQVESVWKKRSGRSVSVILMAYTVTFLMATAVYGVREYGWSLPENALIVNMERVPFFLSS